MGYTNPRIQSGGTLDYVIKVLGIAGTLSAAIVMGLNNQTISLFGVPLKAKCHYTPAFTYFVVANAIVAVYGLISLTLCLCFKAKAPKLCSPKVLFLFDFLMTLLVMSATSAASSVAYIGKEKMDSMLLGSQREDCWVLPSMLCTFLKTLEGRGKG